MPGSRVQLPLSDRGVVGRRLLRFAGVIGALRRRSEVDRADPVFAGVAEDGGPSIQLRACLNGDSHHRGTRCPGEGHRQGILVGRPIRIKNAVVKVADRLRFEYPGRAVLPPAASIRRHIGYSGPAGIDLTRNTYTQARSAQQELSRHGEISCPEPATELGRRSRIAIRNPAECDAPPAAIGQRLSRVPVEAVKPVGADGSPRATGIIGRQVDRSAPVRESRIRHDPLLAQLEDLRAFRTVGHERFLEHFGLAPGRQVRRGAKRDGAA